MSQMRLVNTMALGVILTLFAVFIYVFNYTSFF